MPGLGTSFGRGGATDFLQDLQNSDCIVIMGSNMAENHPVAFQWVMEARERGAKVIHIDPRFTRTSATATKWIGIRAGSDIAFLGGIVNYILQNDLYFEEYVKHYTNAPVIVESLGSEAVRTIGPPTTPASTLAARASGKLVPVARSSPPCWPQPTTKSSVTGPCRRKLPTARPPAPSPRLVHRLPALW